MSRPICSPLLRTLSAIGLALMAASGPAAAQSQTAAPASLPNGASSLQEVYGDWTVVCGTVKGGRLCLMRQEQRQKDSGRLVLAAELHPAVKGKAQLNLIMPFGLRLADGVRVQIDDDSALAPHPFGTCLPAGCLSTVSVTNDLADRMRSGTAAKLTAKAFDSGQDVTFALSLKGFTLATKRLAELAAQH